MKLDIFLGSKSLEFSNAVVLCTEQDFSSSIFLQQTCYFQCDLKAKTTRFRFKFQYVNGLNGKFVFFFITELVVYVNFLGKYIVYSIDVEAWNVFHMLFNIYERNQV